MILSITIDTSDATFPNGDPGFEEWANSHIEERANKLREELIARALSHYKLRAVAFNYGQFGESGAVLREIDQELNQQHIL